jgi:hypothetical protein
LCVDDCAGSEDDDHFGSLLLIPGCGDGETDPTSIDADGGHLGESVEIANLDDDGEFDILGGAALHRTQLVWQRLHPVQHRPLDLSERLAYNQRF